MIKTDAKPTKPRKKSKKPKKESPHGPFMRFVRGWVVPFAVAFAVLTPLRSSLADWNDVPTGSMRPTILEGDRIWVNKLAYGFRVPFTKSWLATWGDIQRGHIVTCASPDGGTRLVKRVIGVPGDRLAMQQNRLTLNGETLDYELISDQVIEKIPDGSGGHKHIKVTQLTEQLPGTPHVVQVTPGLKSPNTWDEVVVPDGHYFVMGDNRDQSKDSRMFQFVQREHIYGRSGRIILSFDRENFWVPRFGRFFQAME